MYKMYNYTTLYYNYTLRIIILYNCIVYNLYIELAQNLYKMYNYTTLYYNYTLRIIILYNSILYNYQKGIIYMFDTLVICLNIYYVYYTFYMLYNYIV